MPLRWNLCVSEFRLPEHLDDGAFRILEGNQVRDCRLGVFLHYGLDPVRGGLPLKRAEIVVRPDLKTEAHALRLHALSQHDRMMIDCVGEIDRILVLGDQGQPENIRVVFRLLLRVRHFIAGMSDLAHADHGTLSDLLSVLRF